MPTPPQLWPFCGALAGLFQELWADNRWVSSLSLCITPHLFLRARVWLLAWACIQLARLDFLDPAQTEPVPLGLYPPSSHLPCLTYLCPHPSVRWLLVCALTGLFLLTAAAAAAGAHCAYAAPTLPDPQLLLSVLFHPLRYAEHWWLPACVHTCCCYCCCKALGCLCHSDHHWCPPQPIPQHQHPVSVIHCLDSILNILPSFPTGWFNIRASLPPCLAFHA